MPYHDRRTRFPRLLKRPPDLGMGAAFARGQSHLIGVWGDLIVNSGSVVDFSNTAGFLVYGNLEVSGRGNFSAINSVGGSMTFIGYGMDNTEEFAESAYPSVNASSLMRFVNCNTFYGS